MAALFSKSLIQLREFSPQGRVPSARGGAFKAFLQDETGATAIEYSLMAAMMAIIAIGAATQLGDVVSEKLFGLAEAMFPEE